MSIEKHSSKIKYVFILLVIWALLMYLSMLSQPDKIVWDEFFFAKFAMSYFSHQYYFDIHPPLGKLMIAGAVSLFGYNTDYGFDFSPGEKFFPEFFFALRFLPAFFGSLFIILFSWLAYLLSRSKIIAFLAGFLILFENAFLVQSKFTLLDIFLIFFGVLTLCFFFLYQRQKVFSGKWFFFLILAGIFFGLAISIKWTGLSVLGIIGLVSLIKIFNKQTAKYLNPDTLFDKKPEDNFFKRYLKSARIKEFMLSLFVLIFIGSLVYLIPFYIHFGLLNQKGFSGRYIQLPPSVNEIPPTGGFFHKFIQLNKDMFKYNEATKNEHPGSSRWYSWPLDYKPIIYWNESNQEDIINGKETASIVFWGNPALFLLVFISIIITLICIVIKKWRRALEPIHYILLIGYFANLLPFIFIKRDSFLYHYLPALVFGVLLLVVWLEKLWPNYKKIFLVIVGLIIFGFVSLVPISYGITIKNDSIIQKYETALLHFFSRGALKYNPKGEIPSSSKTSQ